MTRTTIERAVTLLEEQLEANPALSGLCIHFLRKGLTSNWSDQVTVEITWATPILRDASSSAVDAHARFVSLAPTEHGARLRFHAGIGEDAIVRDVTVSPSTNLESLWAEVGGWLAQTTEGSSIDIQVEAGELLRRARDGQSLSAYARRLLGACKNSPVRSTLASPRVEPHSDEAAMGELRGLLHQTWWPPGRVDVLAHQTGPPGLGYVASMGGVRWERWCLVRLLFEATNLSDGLRGISRPHRQLEPLVHWFLCELVESVFSPTGRLDGEERNALRAKKQWIRGEVDDQALEELRSSCSHGAVRAATGTNLKGLRVAVGVCKTSVAHRLSERALEAVPHPGPNTEEHVLARRALELACTERASWLVEERLKWYALRWVEEGNWWEE